VETELVYSTSNLDSKANSLYCTWLCMTKNREKYFNLNQKITD